MTKEQAIEFLQTKSCVNCSYGAISPRDCLVLECELKSAINMAIKALEQDNEEIFKQFKKKVFLESEDVLGNEMVDSYMITDYLAKLLGVEND